jgi:hypothetical protein
MFNIFPMASASARIKGHPSIKLRGFEICAGPTIHALKIKRKVLSRKKHEGKKLVFFSC